MSAPIPSPGRDWLTPAEAAMQMACSERKVDTLIAEKKILYSKVGRQVRIPRQGIAHYFLANSIRAAIQPGAGPEQLESEDADRLRQWIREIARAEIESVLSTQRAQRGAEERRVLLKDMEVAA